MKSKNLNEVLKALKEIEGKLESEEINLQLQETMNRKEYQLRMIRSSGSQGTNKEEEKTSKRIKFELKHCENCHRNVWNGKDCAVQR